MFRVSTYDHVTSTNDIVKQALELGCPEGLVVRARVQTGGYGRQGRLWTSPAGGLYQSILLRPDIKITHLATLSLLIGLVVRRALTKLVPVLVEDLLLKWPNDLVMRPFDRQSSSFAKLGGISSEVHAQGVCLGTGINVKPPVNRPYFGFKNHPVYLSDYEYQGSVDEVGQALLATLPAAYKLWQQHGFAPFVDEYNCYACLAGRDVTLINNQGSALASGRVRCVDKAGRLMLETNSGVIMPLCSGEVHCR